MNPLAILKKLIKYFSNADYRFLVNAALGFYDHLDDETFLKRKFKACIGIVPDFDDPKTYNEKLNWLKLHNRNPLYTTLVDKYEVKKYIADKIGEQYIIPTLGIWNTFDEIDFEKLPNQFVLKCTHDSGGLVICKDKSALDIKSAKRKINKSLKTNYYLSAREWPYKNVKPRIIAEKYMEDTTNGDLKDYKFFTFNGKVKALYIASERQNKNTETRFDFFDRDFNHLPFTNAHPNADNPPRKPALYEEMIQLAEQLSVGIPHVRVDFYEIEGKIYFGEMTFYHMSGLTPFKPYEWDENLGTWLDLSAVIQK